MNFKKTSIIALGVLFSATMLLSGCSDDKAKVGYYNAERVFNESEQLEEIVAETNKEIEILNKDVEELNKNLELTDEEATKKHLEIQAKASTISAQASRKIKVLVEKAAADLLMDKKLDVVLENNPKQKTVYWGGVDITDDLIQKLKKEQEVKK